MCLRQVFGSELFLFNFFFCWGGGGGGWGVGGVKGLQFIIVQPEELVNLPVYIFEILEVSAFSKVPSPSFNMIHFIQ